MLDEAHTLGWDGLNNQPLNISSTDQDIAGQSIMWDQSVSQLAYHASSEELEVMLQDFKERDLDSLFIETIIRTIEYRKH